MGTLEHRLTDLQSEGIFILTVDGTSELQSNNPLPKRTCTGDKTPAIRDDELLGYFHGGGAEYVVDKCFGSGTSLRSSSIHNDQAISSAFAYGQKSGLFNNETEDAIFEVHAITDIAINKTHYFLMPHRTYLTE